jgi:leader peptidase (prepilin peptidase)/N-methyltransferase
MLEPVSGLPLWLLLIITAAFSLAVGSFLNVVILRLPKRMEHDWRQQAREVLELPAVEESAPPGIVLRASHCPKCGTAIRPWHNIPLLSYLALRGRCHGCGAAISVQYPLVELLTAVASVAVVWWFGPSIQALAALALTWVLVAASGIDFRTTLLPDQLTLPLLWLGLLLNLYGVFVPLEDAVIGAAAGYLSLWSVYWLFKLLTGKEGMGYGDFKLLAALGAWMGWQYLGVIIFLSAVVGAIVGVASIVLRGRDRQVPMPFGPFLAMAGWIALLWGEQIVDWWWRFAR